MSAFRSISFINAFLLATGTLTLGEEDLKFSGTELLDRTVSPCGTAPECNDGLTSPNSVPQIFSISGWNDSAWSAHHFFATQGPRVQVPTLMADNYRNDVA